jgi:predicted RNase H-like nuclease (RuvC/YqgF family)
MTPEQEIKYLKQLIYCTEKSCNNCGKVECENFQRQRKDCCELWVSFKDYILDLKETLAQTIENDEVNYETLKLHDQEEIEMLNSKVTELENKIADIKANCDLAIEGRDVKIKELEQQIKRAVDIIRDLGSTVREGVTCHYLVDNGGLHRATLFIREIEK